MSTSSESLKGRVAVVTGGGRGIGRAIARGLAQAGCKVVITAAREKAEIDAVAREFDDGVIVPLVADVTDPDRCTNVVETAVSRFGRLDILVNNAGRGMRYVSERFFTQRTRFWETSPETWRMIIDTNVNGTFYMTRAAVPTMLSQRFGRIVNISMNYETMQRKGFSPYGPSKAALESETIIWSKDLADSGVTVNALLPGAATWTGMISESVPEPYRSQMVEPEIMVAPMLWLASEASNDTTGMRIIAKFWGDACANGAAAQPAMVSAGWPAGA